MKIFKTFEKIFELAGWLQIVFSFTVIGAIIGLIIYYSKQTFPVLIIAIIVSLAGLIFGIVFATRMFKTKGTVWFISRVSASPELDNLDNEK